MNGTWRGRDRAGRRQWLADASARWFGGGHRAARAVRGATITLATHGIEDLESFLCALGEAIHGPGGYFGVSLLALDDCLVGGFGLEPPWRLVTDVEHLMRVLDATALVSWAEDRIARHDFLDAYGERWLRAAVEEAKRGERTLWDELHAVFAAHGVEVARATVEQG